MKRRDSLKEDDQPFIDPEAITEYLDLMNDFVKNSIGEEVDRRNSNISESLIEEEKDELSARDRRFSSRISEEEIIEIQESVPEPILIIKRGGRKK